MKTVLVWLPNKLNSRILILCDSVLSARYYCTIQNFFDKIYVCLENYLIFLSCSILLEKFDQIFFVVDDYVRFFL